MSLNFIIFKFQNKGLVGSFFGFKDIISLFDFCADPKLVLHILRLSQKLQNTQFLKDLFWQSALILLEGHNFYLTCFLFDQVESSM